MDYCIFGLFEEVFCEKNLCKYFEVFFFFFYLFILVRNNFLVFNDLEGCDAVIFSLFWKMGCRKVFSSQLICVCVCYVGIDKEQFIEESL